MKFTDSSAKTNWRYLAIAVVFALFVGGGIIWYTQSFKPIPSQTISIPKTPTSQQQLDTSRWQTYRNEEFGFEVRYPPEYERKEFCRPHDGDAKDSRIFVGPIIIKKIDTGGLDFEEYVTQVIQDAKREVEKYGDRVFVVESQERITFAGKEAIKVVSQFCGAGCYNPTEVYAKQDGDVVKITYDDGIINQCAFDSYELPSEVADQILSTFRFTPTP